MQTLAVSKAASRPLDAYNAKRRFGLTSEPRGARAHSRSKQLRFVVQQHDATRMHFDFRLELDGVLLSWAVPKGPSLSPADKRLAVQTEDHPLSYRDFEGTIAEGEYGGGPVIVWDRGHWQPEGDPREGFEQGHLKFTLQGEKLRGGYVLVRTRGKVREGPKSTWLLIKHADEHVRSGAAAEITQRLRKSVISGKTVEQIERAGRLQQPPPAKVRESVGAISALSRRNRKQPVRSVRPELVEGPARRFEPAPGSPLVLRQAQHERRTQSAKPSSGSCWVGAAPGRDCPEVELQLATATDRPPTSGPWIYEIKFDGYRMLARLDAGKVQLLTRNKKDWTARFPGIVAALAKLKRTATVLDGEICFVDDDGRTRFEGLQTVLGERGHPSRRGAGGAGQERLKFFVFDILFDGGQDVRPEHLRERKKRLRTLLGRKPPDALVYSDDVEAEGRVALAQACAAGLEGLIAKRADASYRAGRGTSWLKLKCHRRQEFAIVGLTAPAGARSDFGALLLAVREGSQWAYRGKVGTGFSQQTLKELGKKLLVHKLAKSVLTAPPRLAGVTWVEPRLICEVEFTEMTSEGRLRHPSFVGIREDKKVLDVTDVVIVKSSQLKTSSQKSPKQAGADRLEIQGVSISHPERVVDTGSGVTKGELARYLDAVHPLLMPYAEGRPIALVRCPDGDAQACFFQKHKAPGMGAQVQRARVQGQEALYIDDVHGLIQLVQFNAVELHGWGARVKDSGRPDWLVIDLDPDVSLTFADVVQAAFEVRDFFAQIGLKTFVKTTGGKGLHVVAPLTPQADWERAKAFAKATADALAAIAPERYVATLSKAKRRGKIFVDYLRNAKGATAVLPYSPRARPGATVAMPMEWKQLDTVQPQDFTVRTAARWLAKRRRDPWREFFELEQTLPDMAPKRRSRTRTAR